MSSGKQINVGVVGLGKMGILHASILNVLPNVHLAALCDKSWIMRKLAKNILKDTLVTDDLDKFANLGLDVVYITTPIPSHFSIIKQIYTQNIASNIFCEKTLSSNIAKSEELCTMANNSKGCTMVGYMKRFSVTFQKAKELISQNLLGTVFSFDAYAYSSDFFGVERDAVASARGGVLEDLGSHVSDLAFWFFSDQLKSISILSSTQKPDTVQYDVQGVNGFKGQFDISWIKEGYRMPEFGLIIRGAKGTLKVDDNELMLTVNDAQTQKWYRQNLDDHVGYLLGDSEYFREDDYFIRSIVSNSKPEPSFETAAKVDFLLEQVRCNASE